jgi:hypothetical protein
LRGKIRSQRKKKNQLKGPKLNKFEKSEGKQGVLALAPLAKRNQRIPLAAFLLPLDNAKGGKRRKKGAKVCKRTYMIS